MKLFYLTNKDSGPEPDLYLCESDCIATTIEQCLFILPSDKFKEEELYVYEINVGQNILATNPIQAELVKVLRGSWLSELKSFLYSDDSGVIEKLNDPVIKNSYIELKFLMVKKYLKDKI